MEQPEVPLQVYRKTGSSRPWQQHFMTSGQSSFSNVRKGFGLARPVLCWILAGALLGCAACSRSPQARAEKHYARAQDLIKSSKTEDAIIELRRAVQLVPGMAKAHHELAKLYLQRGNLNPGSQELLLAVRYDPDDRDAQLLLAELLLQSSHFDEAKKRAEFILEKWPDARSASLVLAESLMGLRAFEAARKVVDQVLQAEPKNARALFGLAALQLQAKQMATAEATLRQVWDLKPDSLVPPLVLSNLMLGRGDSRGAESVLRRAVELQPNSLPPLYVLASFYVQQRRFPDAEAAFKRIQSLGYDTPQHRGVLAEFYSTTNRSDEAEREYKRILAADPKDKLNWQHLAEFYFAQNRRAEARQIVDRLVKENPKDWETLLLRGVMATEDGKPEEGLQYLLEARSIFPESPLPYFYQAKAYLAQGYLELAKDTLADGLRQDPGYLPARIVLAELEVRGGKVDQAIHELNKALEQMPAAVEPYLLLSQAYALKGEFQLAENNLKRLINLAPSPTTVTMILRTLAWVKFRQGRHAEASQLAVRSLEADPKSREGLYLLGLTYLARKQPEKGLQVVGDYVRNSPDWAAGHEVLGSLALQAGKLDLAERSFQKAIRLDSRLTAAITGLGEVYGLRNLPDASRQNFQRVAELEPQNAFVQVRLGQIAEMESDWSNAISAYKKAIELDPANRVAKNNLAWVYAEHAGNLDVALRLAQEARQAGPDDPTTSDTLGWIYVKKGFALTGMPYLTESLTKKPTNPVYHYHVGVAYFQLGQNTRAKSELNRSTSSPGFFGRRPS